MPPLNLTVMKSRAVDITGLEGGGALGPMLWGPGPGIPPDIGPLCPDTGPRASIALGSRPKETNAESLIFIYEDAQESNHSGPRENRGVFR